MRRATLKLATAVKGLLVLPLLLAAFASGAAAGYFDEAQRMVNPEYLKPEIPFHLKAACQVVVKTPVPAQYGVTSDDLLYCDLPRHSSRFPSDTCACPVRLNGIKVLRPGMVVWRPSTWWYLVPVPR